MDAYDHIYFKVARQVYINSLPGSAVTRTKAKEELDEQFQLVQRLRESAGNMENYKVGSKRGHTPKKANSRQISRRNITNTSAKAVPRSNQGQATLASSVAAVEASSASHGATQNRLA